VPHQVTSEMDVVVSSTDRRAARVSGTALFFPQLWFKKSVGGADAPHDRCASCLARRRLCPPRRAG
jgi:hypothetical protein